MQPQNFERALLATQKLAYGIPNAFGIVDHCSSFFISNQGHFITNLHCLGKCFKKTWDFMPTYPHETIKEEKKSTQVLKIKRQDGELESTEIYCPMNPGGFNLHNEVLNRENPRIVWIGKGEISLQERKILEIPQKVRESLAKYVDDYVILKYDLEEGERTSCVPLAKAKPKDKDPIWLIGFPKSAKRKSSLNADSSKKISVGVVRDDLEEDLYLQKILGKNRKAKTKALKEIFGGEKILRSKIDAYVGNSGGLMVNEIGDAVAVLFGAVKVSSEKDYKSTIYGMDMQYIKSEIERGLGEKRTEVIFSCQD